MDNENKNLQDNELTPEERVQEDISNKIADAAAEIQEEILEANGEEVPANAETGGEAAEEGEADESWSDEAWAVVEEEKSEPITIKKGHFILSLIASALIGAIITVCCFNAPGWIANIPSGNTVAAIDGAKVTDLDLNYYICMEVYEYAQENQMDPASFDKIDWDEEIDGVKLEDKIKQDALDAAINDAVLISLAKEKGVALTESDDLAIEARTGAYIDKLGEDGLILQTRTMGITSVKQYVRYLRTLTLADYVKTDIAENPDKYYPEDKSVLNEYIDEGKVSAKHILIKVEDEAADEEKRAHAQSVLDRINAGEDFDTLMAEFNEDTGEPKEGYTFVEGEMVSEFYEAALALEVGQVSELVKSTYGYHIIKRVDTEAGEDELYSYLAEQTDKKVYEKKIAKISVKDIIADVIKANDELAAQQTAN